MKPNDVKGALAFLEARQAEAEAEVAKPDAHPAVRAAAVAKAGAYRESVTILRRVLEQEGL